MKRSNVSKYPIACDTLLITDADSGVKQGVPKLLLECSMQQLHNELISSPYDGGLLGSRHADTKNVIISDTMLCSLENLELSPMTDHRKIMCSCAIHFKNKSGILKYMAAETIKNYKR